MNARDVMVSPVITVTPSATVQDVAKLLLERRISAVPVVDDQGKLIGIVSEGDLMQRSEIGSERRHSWWLSLISSNRTLAADYIKTHAKSVADVMTRKVFTALPQTPLHEIALLLERHSIKRVPIVEDARVIGIVSRANLVQVLAAGGGKPESPGSDVTIRNELLAHLRAQPWADAAQLNVIVTDGVVSLWGIVDSQTERKALRVAAEATPGVRAVDDNMIDRQQLESRA